MILQKIVTLILLLTSYAFLGCTHKHVVTDNEKLKVEFFHSKPASFIHFLRAGFKEPHTSKSVQSLIQQNEITEFSSETHKNDFRIFWDSLGDGYNFNGLLKTRPEGFYGEDAVISASILNKTFEDFEKNLTVFMPFKSVIAYFRLKKVFLPSFKKYMWDPSYPKFTHSLKKLHETMNESEFTNTLQKTKTFYNSEFPPRLTMKVALVPIPDRDKLKKKYTSAQSIKNLQLVPYFTKSGPRGSLDVIFHEFSHTLYFSQSSKTKKMIEDFYLKNDHSHARFVYKYFNEAIATTLGNGIYFEKVKNSFPKGKWYTDKYINGLAKAYYTTLKSYLNTNKRIDINFLNKTLTIAKQTFPKAPIETQNNMISLTILSGHPDVQSVKLAKQIQKHFRVQSYSNYDGFGKQEVQSALDRSLSTTIILSKRIKDVPSSLLKKFKLPRPRNNPSMISIFRKNGAYYFWINVRTKKQVQKALLKLKGMPTLPAKDKLIKL